MPTAALADEILLEGEGQVKALICIGGNPMAAWPDQRKTERALESLELLVTLDTEMSLTSRLADYVIAPKMQMETPAMTAGSELIKYYTSGTGIPGAVCAVRAAAGRSAGGFRSDRGVAVLPRAGQADGPGAVVRQLLRRWRRPIHGVAADRGGNSTVTSELTTEELFAQMCATSRIPLDEVRSHPHGKIFDVDAVVEERDADCTARLDVGNEVLLVRAGRDPGRGLPGRAGRHRRSRCG